MQLFQKHLLNNKTFTYFFKSLQLHTVLQITTLKNVRCKCLHVCVHSHPCLFIDPALKYPHIHYWWNETLVVAKKIHVLCIWLA